MHVKPRSYPHPVLSHFSDDIVESQFQSTVKITGSKTAYVFEVVSKTSNQDLLKLIKSGAAEYAVHVECALTRYRSFFADRAERFRFELPATAVDGRVEVCSFILALTNLSRYTNQDFHPDYRGLSFTVRKGDTLAVSADQSFIAEKKMDPLRKIPSIFLVIRNEADDAPAIDIDTSGHKVIVKLSKTNYETYAFVKRAQPLHSSLNSMIIVPALVAVLEDVERAANTTDGLVSLESRRWYSTLSRRLKDLGVDPADPESFTDSSPSLAQRLIGEPLTEGLKTLRSYEETDE